MRGWVCLLMAHRDISLRCRIWSYRGIADIESAAPIKLGALARLKPETRQRPAADGKKSDA